MQEIYVFGHRNPDTDSVTAAIALAYLKRKMGLKEVLNYLKDISLLTPNTLKSLKKY